MAYNQYDANNLSLVKTGNLTEMYVPLWYYSSGSNGSSQATANTSSFIYKGGTGVTTNTSSSAKLHTLSSNWSPNQQFAFEASLETGGASYAANAQLYDFTSSSAVSGSQVSTTSTSFTLIRSGKFTLTPGHVYGVQLWIANNVVSASLTKASLIAFLS